MLILGPAIGAHDLGGDLVAAELAGVADDLAVIDDEHGRTASRWNRPHRRACRRSGRRPPPPSPACHRSARSRTPRTLSLPCAGSLAADPAPIRAGPQTRTKASREGSPASHTAGLGHPAPDPSCAARLSDTGACPLSSCRDSRGSEIYGTWPGSRVTWPRRQPGPHWPPAGRRAPGGPGPRGWRPGAAGARRTAGRSAIRPARYVPADRRRVRPGRPAPRRSPAVPSAPRTSAAVRRRRVPSVSPGGGTVRPGAVSPRHRPPPRPRPVGSGAVSRGLSAGCGTAGGAGGVPPCSAAADRVAAGRLGAGLVGARPLRAAGLGAGRLAAGVWPRSCGRPAAPVPCARRAPCRLLGRRPLLAARPSPRPRPPGGRSIRSSETITPRPLQHSHGSENASSRPEPTRLRVICTSPSEVTSATWCLVRSRARHSSSRRSTSSRLLSSTMSMKSITMIPPTSRSLQLPDDLLGRLQVVAGDGLLQVAALAGELPGVDVHDRHGLGGVDDQRAAAGQPHLAVQRLGQLLVDPVVGERVLVRLPVVEPVRQVRGDVADVLVHQVPALVAGDDQLAEVLVEDVPDHPDGQVRLAVEQLGRVRRLRLARRCSPTAPTAARRRGRVPPRTRPRPRSAR